MIQPNEQQKGFTILELMIATTIFSLVLMITLAGIIQITKMYFQGTTLNRTQEVARSVVDDIGESLRFTKEPISLPSPVPPASNLPELGTTGTGIDTVIVTQGDPDTSNHTGFFCIGPKRYSFAIDRQLVTSSPDITKKEKRHVLWVDQPASCNTIADLTTDLTGGEELLNENMRLTRFNIFKSGDIYKVDISVVYGDSDLIEYTDNPVTCKSAFAGSEFCAVANLSISVSRRL